MEALGHVLHGYDGDIHGQIPVQIVLDLIVLHVRVCLEAGCLAVGVDAYLRAGSAEELHILTCHLPDDLQDLVGDGVCGLVFSETDPALVAAAVIFYSKLDIAHGLPPHIT